MRPRRQNLTETDVTHMRSLEAQGKTRKEIAFEMNCSQSCVTRKLGLRPKEVVNEEAQQAVAA